MYDPRYYYGGYHTYYPTNQMNGMDDRYGWGDYNNYSHYNHRHHHHHREEEEEEEDNNYDEYQNGNYEGEEEKDPYEYNYHNYHHPYQYPYQYPYQNPYGTYYNYGNQDEYDRRRRHYYESHKKKEKKEERKEEKKEEKKEKTRDELILDYENNIRKEIEETTPLLSEKLDIKVLIDEYKSNEEYLKSVENVSKKYKYMRKVRRDGNCFYRSFIYRLFEHIFIKNDKNLYEKIKQKIINVKELTEKNGYEWIIVEDFYDLFLEEYTNCYNCVTSGNNVRSYLDNLFSDKDKGTYLVYFLRFCIAAYLKENKEKYQLYIEGSFDDWIRKEVEAIDHCADEIQITACVNYFDIGVKIEYLNKNEREIVKFPDDKPDDEFFIFLLYTPGHYDILYP